MGSLATTPDADGAPPGPAVVGDPAGRPDRRIAAAGAVLVALLVLAVVAAIGPDDADTDHAAGTSTTAPPTSARRPLTATAPAGPVPPPTPPPGLIADPTSRLVLVDRTRALPEAYAPPDLIDAPVPFTFAQPDPRRMVRREVAGHLGDLFAGAAAAGLPLVAISGYRSFQTQRNVHDSYLSKDGQADRYSAAPGHSEHQTGLAMDVTGADGLCPTEDCFAARPEARWLAEHAADYGFIVRYPQGKEAVTGYNYEPWHLRYVGIDVARELRRRGLTLDEWMGTAGQ